MLSLRAEFAIRQRGGQARRPKLQNISAPAPIAPPPPSGTGAVPIRSKRLNYVAKKTGATGAKATVGKATGKTVVPKIPLTTPIQEAEKKAEAKAAYQNKLDELRPKPTPATPPTPVERGTAKGEEVTAKKAKVASDEKDALYDKYGGRQSGGQGFEIPYITPAFRSVGNTIRDKVVNPVARGLIGRDMDAGEIRGTLAALTIAPAAIGGLAYNSYKNKEAEKEKQAQAQAHRDKVAEIIAKRNLLLEQRQSQTQQPTQPRVPYNFFSAAPLVTPANFAFPKIGVRNPFFIKKEKALPLAAVGGTLVAGYGLLSKLNKQRALDAYKVNSLKDKNAQDFAANYFDSPQYHADNLIREAANITGNPLLQGITDNPLDRLTPAQQAEVQKRKGKTTRYSRAKGKTAEFMSPEDAQLLYGAGFVGSGIGGALIGSGVARKLTGISREDFTNQNQAFVDELQRFNSLTPEEKKLQQGSLREKYYQNLGRTGKYLGASVAGGLVGGTIGRAGYLAGTLPLLQYSDNSKTANFFDPLITPSLAIGGTLYGIYNRKKAADQQEEVFEAQKLAALDAIKDKQLRRALIAQAKGDVIDDGSRNRIIDAALNGDVKSVLRTGLKNVNWNAL